MADDPDYVRAPVFPPLRCDALRHSRRESQSAHPADTMYIEDDRLTEEFPSATERRGGRRDQEEKTVPQVLLQRHRP